MNSRRTGRSIATLAVSIAGLVGVYWFVRAGNLEPPGPPAPTMKTLVEVEPRVAINAENTPGNAVSLFLITNPGSYYLTGNITGVSTKNGIDIRSSRVTVDLMGFAMEGVPGSGDGVVVQCGNKTDITLKNGVVSGWSGHGVNMCANDGTVSNVRANSNAGDGIRIVSRSVARECESIENNGAGIRASGLGNIIEHCMAINNHDDGIDVYRQSYVHHNSAVENGCGAVQGLTSAGIHVRGDGNRVEDNYASLSYRNFKVDVPANLIVKNAAYGTASPGCPNAMNYEVHPSVPISISDPYNPGTAGPWANFSLP